MAVSHLCHYRQSGAGPSPTQVRTRHVHTSQKTRDQTVFALVSGVGEAALKGFGPHTESAARIQPARWAPSPFLDGPSSAAPGALGYLTHTGKTNTQKQNTQTNLKHPQVQLNFTKQK